MRDGDVSKQLVLALWITLSIFAPLFACSRAEAQTAKEELAAIRESLNLPPTTSIILGDSSSVLPSDRPLKLYVATGLDMDVHENFEKWLVEWNKKNGKKFGIVETVPDVQDADVILLRYTLKNKVTEKTDSSSAVVPATVYDWGTKTWITRPVTRSYSDSESLVPAYDYVIAKTNTSLQILWRHVGEAQLDETKKTGELLRDDFFQMMKTDAKKQQR